MQPELIRLTREELYDKVWTEPVRALAKQFGISGVGLAKACKRLKVPVPGRGYWAKKAVGTRVTRIPLPALPPNDAVTPRETVFQPAQETLPPPPLTGPVAQQVAFEADPANSIAVPEALHSAHPLVRATREALDSSGKKEARSVGDRQAHHLDIDVTKASLRRALRIMDALVKAFEARGWKVSLGAGDDRKSYVTILGQQLPFGIRETLKKVLNEPPKPQRLSDGTIYTPWQSKYRDEPSGRLALVIRYSWGYGVSKSWVETTTRPLEDRLRDFIISLVRMANEGVERDRRHEGEERARQEAEGRRVAEQRRREAEAARVRALDRQASQWEGSRRLRDYLTAVRAAAESQRGGLHTCSEFTAWLAWAEAHARSIDPLQQPLDSLLTVEPLKPR